MIVGDGEYRYEAVEGWGNFPEEWDYRTVPGISIDAQDRVFLLSRGNPPVAIFDKNGICQESFGDGVFDRAHGVCPLKDGTVYCVDDAAHAVYRFSPERELIQTIGRRGVPSDTGCIDKKWKTIKQAAGPFNYPTNMVFAENGMFYVTDGYGNARVHCFKESGILLLAGYA